MFLEPARRLERCLPIHHGGLVARAPPATHDVVDADAVEGHHGGQPAQHGAQRVGVVGDELDGVAGEVLRDHLALPVEDRTARWRQRHRAQPVGLGTQLILLVLEDLRAEEGAGKHEEGERDDPARTARTPLQVGGVQVVHCWSSRMRNQPPNSTSSTVPASAVVSA